jgi:sugar (pentulose or hexulose) kinase
LLGLDVGTTWCKAIVLDAEGSPRGLGRAATPWKRVSTGAEIDPHALAEAAFAAAREAIEAASGRISAIGVTSMAEAGALLDSDGDPVAPAIAWFDERGAEEAERLASELPTFTRHTGLPATRTATVAKHRWLRDKGALTGTPTRWLNVAEWVVRRLGGGEVAELSLASRTGYLDVDDRDWWPLAADWAEAPPGFLPTPVIAGTPAGHCNDLLHPKATGAVLTVAGHDHLCAVVGAGAVRPGDVLDSCGTAEALVRAVQPPLPEGVVEAAVDLGLTVGWHVLWQRLALIGGFESGKLLEGLDLESEAGRATVERLAARATELKQAIERIAGPTSRLVVAGGWSEHPIVAEVKLEVLGQFERAPHPEAGARGAAVLGGVASKVRATESV